MHVYRVEDEKSGLGAYSLRERVDFPRIRNHVGPWHDNLTHILDNRDYHFAFPSLDDLASWFIDGLTKLHIAGCICRVYDVNNEDVRIGRTRSQLIFKKSRATPIKSIDLISIYALYKNQMVSIVK